jgi:hypothetical protein
MLDILLSYVEPVVDGKPMLTVLSVALTGFVCVALYSAARKLTAALALILLVVTGAATLLIRDSLLATDLLVGSLALCLGMLVGQWIRSRTALAIFVVTAAVGDLTSFFAGTTRSLIGGSARALRYLAICMTLGNHVYAVVGIGDLVLLTACSIAIRNCRYPEWAAFALPLSGILGALLLALSVGPLPALPFLAAAVLGYQYLAKEDAPRRASTIG